MRGQTALDAIKRGRIHYQTGMASSYFCWLEMDCEVVESILENRRIQPPSRQGRREEEEEEEEDERGFYREFSSLFFSASSCRLGRSIPRIFRRVDHHPGTHHAPFC
jgi:hypothetical protein